MANFTTLYSGSSGNCAWVEENGKYLLVDMGQSCRTTVTSLQALECNIHDMAGILVTHEHSDHVKGLAVFLKKYPIPVFATAATLDYLTAHGLVPVNADLVETDGRTLDVDGFTVRSFATSHDSVDCCGYAITTPQGKRVSLATDLGYVSDEVLANLLEADMVSLEANYDLHMLMTGPYPGYLKQRILSGRGHLDNTESAATVTKLIENGCANIALCHISKENNSPQLALQAVQASLLANGVIPKEGVRVQACARYEISPKFTF